ncbi:hypothetical protein F5Y19DRAFT_474233 [Xylariaceae sp. FL1651]|nr:hypothetical protein F5Y19DRAFT_474233 [Xylariaceae sp. FL1651]
MAPTAQGTLANPEYQHFVPQFMLRNFAHKYRGPKHPKRGKKKDAPFHGELVVNNVNLKADIAVIEETKVKRIFGKYDMYQDTSQLAVQQRRIETMLGGLECHVSTIFHRIIKAFEAKDPSVWVTRDERNSIRKFLFLLKYRGPTFHRRFHHESLDQYEADDKARLRVYMEENNFERPVDVWFHGINTIIKLKMDPEGHWKEELVKKMYRDDAMWFIMHTEMMYMAICASEQPTEFILTENSYNVFEGPNTFTTDPITGEVVETGWTNLHEFAPLSPKLMIVLRSFLLSVPEEDSNPNIREERQTWRKMVASEDCYKDSLQSSLADLPIHKPRNNYSDVIDSQIRLRSGEDGTKRKNHKFCFPFFPIGKDHVNKINSILFDNAYRCMNIVFHSKDAFHETLESYMTSSSTLGKKITLDAPTERRKLLVNLAAIMKSLGSTKEPVWTEIPGPTMLEFNRIKTEWTSLQNGIADLISSIKKEHKKNPKSSQGLIMLYLSLGGSEDTFLDDLDQSERMLKLRVKIDVWSKGIPEHIRAQARDWLIGAYLRCPSRRILFFVKSVRSMILEQDNQGYSPRRGTSQVQPDEPEDVIAEAMHDKMTSEKLNRLMYKTVMNQIEKAKDPSLDLHSWARLPRSMEGALWLMKAHAFVFGIPGQLKDCEITEIAELAVRQEKRIREQNLTETLKFHHPFLDDDEEVEILTRVMVKPKFRGALSTSVEPDLLQKLERVLFEISYPTPPIKLSF